ncbi:MAG TPA: DUF2851 family protein [Candidatus Acidoferrales bacterium]|nr:DUF2851 family protein [Candidatus Acidoferrales bacterium]
MDFRTDNFYATWRGRSRGMGALHDAGPVPPEKLLQAIWQHQRIHRGGLKTTDGKPVRVLHPGFNSVEGGPDFRGAVLQFGDARPVAGDVEIDLQPGGWRAHGHDRNPAFKNVILHVIWNGDPSVRPKTQGPETVLALENYLDASIGELARALENESGLPEALRGKCCAPLRELLPEQLAGLLQSAAKVRFQNKAAAILARAKNCGWEQALWENLFRALGYKHNVWPMLSVAETRSRWSQGADSAFELQARLLGISGLLPDELTRTQKNADTFLRRAWDCWWRDRDALAGCTLPRAVWKFHGLRPANHPQRRLALAAHWLASENLAGKIEDWILAEVPDKGLLDSLHQIFQVKRDEFWSWHWTFRSEPMTKPQPLLGEARITDLAVNVVLPWLWTRANEGGSEKIRQEVERRFLAWPSAEDNSVLKLARQRLLGTANARSLKGAAQQQGLMQIVRDFCEHSNAVCADCQFPEMVRGWSQRP